MDAWHNPSNPTPLNNTGRSIIYNDQVEIQIDYEVVDLGWDDPNNWIGSPLACWDQENNKSGYVRSDRYVFLQTYTITNKTRNNSTVENIEFYQMLHSHGDDEYGKAVSSVYQDFNYDDPLEDYIPYNPVHAVGKFRFDITQWNDPDHPDSIGNGVGGGDHLDWVGFSCTIEPDTLENGIYRGHDDEPTVGTHKNIENRDLNEETEIFYDEVAGAMGWYLGSLDPNESVSITVAYMFGHGEIVSPFLYLDKYSDKTDPNYCALPDNSITYTIEYGNPVSDPQDPNYLGNLYDVEIVDYLPLGVYLDSADPNDYFYDSTMRTCTWYIPLLEPGDMDTITLTVTVNNAAEPLSELTNTVKMITDFGWITASETNNICCWEHDDAVTGVIYVDQRATGYNTGTCWDDAYVSLRSALDRAAKGCGDEIWVARGVYEPGGDDEATFDLVDDVEVYGGFIGNETAIDQRNFVQNKTFLSGDDVCSIVVTGDDVSNTAILDGFIIQAGTSNGIYCDRSDPVIANCVIMDNGGDGMYCYYCEPTISDCVIKDNDGDGIEFYGSGSSIIERSKIYDNTGYGIYAQSSSPVITNNWIHHNDEGGIYLSSAAANIRNNTIAHNYNVGVKKYSGTAPTISNCILWENQDDLDGCTATYSCIQDGDNGDGNIDSYPKFAYEDPNASYNYHLDPESPCIDAGNDSVVAQDETDIDGDDRIYDWIPSTTNDVDMGADEVACDEVSNKADWNADGIVNLFEYADLANAWLNIDPEYTTDPNFSENWNPLCDLNDDHYIDLVDLYYLCDNWLWQACWLNPDTWMMMSMGGGGLGRGMATEPLSASEIEAAKFRKWQIHRPTYWPNLQEEVWMLEDIIRWLTDIWYQHEEVRKEFDEKDYFDFVESIKDMLKEKVKLLLSNYKEKTYKK